MATQNTVSQPAKSFSTIVQQEKTQTRDQGIILDAIEGYTVEEYAIALAKVINPKDILYVSRINGSRICFYLSNKQLVDTLLEKKTKLIIGNEHLEIKSLVSKAPRIIISNVQPCIPTSLITEELNKLNVFPISRISTMKAGIQSSALSHLLSFRKQMYVRPEDVCKIPAHMRITHESVNFWIYFSSEKMTCFKCKEEGHLAKYCKNLETTISQNIPETQVQGNTPEVTTDSTSFPKNNDNQDIEEKDASTTMITTGGFKRPYCSSTSTSSIRENDEDRANLKSNNSKIKQAKKKIKENAEYITDYVKQLEPVRNYLESNVDKYPLSYDQFRKFLVNTRGKSNVIETARSYTSDLRALIGMLADTYVHLNERNIKNRITRIRNILQENEESITGFLTDDSVHTDDDHSENASCK